LRKQEAGEKEALTHDYCRERYCNSLISSGWWWFMVVDVSSAVAAAGLK